MRICPRAVLPRTLIALFLVSTLLPASSWAGPPGQVKQDAITVINAYLQTFNLSGTNRTGYDPYSFAQTGIDKIQTESTAMALYYGGVENLGLNATQLQEIYDFFAYMMDTDDWLYSDYTTSAGREYKKSLHNAWSLIALDILVANGITDSDNLIPRVRDALEAGIDVNGYMSGDPDSNESIRTKFVQALPFLLKIAQDTSDTGAIAAARLSVDFYMANCIDANYDVWRTNAAGAKVLLINSHEAMEFAHGLAMFHQYETDATRKTTIQNNIIGILNRYTSGVWSYTNSFGEVYLSDQAASGTVNTLATFQIAYVLEYAAEQGWMASGLGLPYLDIVDTIKITGTGDAERDNNFYYQANPDNGAQISSNINSYQPGYLIFAIDAMHAAISGTVQDGGSAPIAGVVLSADSGGGTDTTDANGDYDLLVPNGWSGTVTPSKAEYSFAPPNNVYASVSAGISNEDYTGTYAPDLTPPTPDPMTWASLPTATNSSSIAMTATTATDADSPPVEYFFECTNDGSASSGWQSSPSYEATGLSSSTLYTFEVKARDAAAALNETGWSSSESATTPAPPPITVYDFTGISSPSTTHLAEDGEIDVSDSVIENGTFAGRRNFGSGWNNWNEASTGEYSSLTGSDDTRYQGADPGFGDNAAMLFTFHVDEDPVDITQIDISVELGRNASTDLGWVYIWDYSANAYLVLGSQSGTSDQIVAATITTNPGNYVEPGTGEVTVFAVNEDTSDWIRVDEISVTIHAAPSAVCGNDVLESGEQCDDGNTSGGDCCSATCSFESAATVCRTSADLCDVAEMCSGSSGTCPADGFASAATECRASAGLCDVAETCSGSGASCPADGFAPAATECRASAGLCDVAEMCSGSGASCPADGFAPAATECRGSAGFCDVAEMCSGSGASCPADGFAPAATECRGSAGLCDVAESCTGSDALCPGDTLVTAGTECRGAAGFCDVAESCTGSDALCPGDTLVTAGTECRGAADVCDVAEVCTGSDTACPVDGFASAATECRGSAGFCDVAEMCSGSGASCPADGFASAATECRGSAGLCDVAEMCSGTGASCPADGFASAGTECRGAAEFCDLAEACTGVDASCPADELVLDGTLCLDGDVCNGDEQCQAGACVAVSTLDCDDGNLCTADSCDAALGCAHTPIEPCVAYDLSVPSGSKGGYALLILLIAATATGSLLIEQRRLRG